MGGAYDGGDLQVAHELDRGSKKCGWGHVDPWAGGEILRGTCTMHKWAAVSDLCHSSRRRERRQGCIWRRNGRWLTERTARPKKHSRVEHRVRTKRD